MSDGNEYMSSGQNKVNKNEFITLIYYHHTTIDQTGLYKYLQQVWIL